MTHIESMSKKEIQEYLDKKSKEYAYIKDVNLTQGQAVSVNFHNDTGYHQVLSLRVSHSGRFEINTCGASVTINGKESKEFMSRWADD